MPAPNGHAGSSSLPHVNGENGACAFPTCTDGVKNGDETDADCGGATCGAPPASDSGVGKKNVTCPQKDPVIDASTFKQEDCTSNMLCVPAALS